MLVLSLGQKTTLFPPQRGQVRETVCPLPVQPEAMPAVTQAATERKKCVRIGHRSGPAAGDLPGQPPPELL